MIKGQILAYSFNGLLFHSKKKRKYWYMQQHEKIPQYAKDEKQTQENS